ncbi:tRNA proofreading protein [Klebsiella pneumoniae]|nr:tRNA proofreading protein [Klebsiella pneumoniae]
MSLQSVRSFFAEHAPDIEIIELNQSTATGRTCRCRTQR